MTDIRLNKNGQPRKPFVNRGGGIDYLAKIWPSLIEDAKKEREQRKRAEEAMRGRAQA